MKVTKSLLFSLFTILSVLYFFSCSLSDQYIIKKEKKADEPVTFNEKIIGPGSTANIVYVNVSGNDDFPGTPERPFLTIAKGISAIAESGMYGEVHVSAGTYNESLIIRNNVGLYGGYNRANWADRDNQNRTHPDHMTIINGIDATGIVSAVRLSSGLSGNTILDGFLIYPSFNTNSTSTDCYSVYIYEASPVISNNTICGDEGRLCDLSIAVMSSYSSPVFLNNIIEGGIGKKSHGIKARNSIIKVDNNFVSGGTGEYTYGIMLLDTSAEIFNQNTIYGGSGVFTYGIYSNSASGSNPDSVKVVINNNYIIPGNSTNTVYGIYNNKTPAIIKNNNIIDGVSVVCYGVYLTGSTADISGNFIIGGLNSIKTSGVYISGSRNKQVTISENDIVGGINSRITYGIYAENSDTLLINTNKSISGGKNSTTASYGIYTASSSLNIENNKEINGGHSGLYTYGIYNAETARLYIYENLIEGGTGTSKSYGIYSRDSSFTQIYNNEISGGGLNDYSIGVYNIDNAVSYIFKNHIDGGRGTRSIGIYNLTDETPAPEVRIINNTVSGGHNNVQACGIINDKYNASIYNNTIYTGIAETVYGIKNYDCTYPGIENNIIFSPKLASTARAYGIYNLRTFPTVRYNDIFVYKDRGSSYIGMDGNIYASPFFVSGTDWHLTSETPAAITEGAAEMEFRFTDDKDGEKRTESWSMGAYEFDKKKAG